MMKRGVHSRSLHFLRTTAGMQKSGHEEFASISSVASRISSTEKLTSDRVTEGFRLLEIFFEGSFGLVKAFIYILFGFSKLFCKTIEVLWIGLLFSPYHIAC